MEAAVSPAGILEGSGRQVAGETAGVGVLIQVMP